MPKYQVSVEVTRSYVVDVEADTAEGAVSRVREMDLDEIEKDDFYVDTVTDVDDDPERAE